MICDMSQNPQFLELFVADVGIDLVMQHAEVSRQIAEQCASAVNPHTGLRFQMGDVSVVQHARAQQGSSEENAVADRKAGVKCTLTARAECVIQFLSAILYCILTGFD